MNYYNPSDIKIIRKKLDLSQSSLAKYADVSQSLIAKIEADKIDPSYSNIKKIFDAVDSLKVKNSLQAKDFIHKGVVSCQKDNLVREVIKKMKKYEISQLPVVNKQSVIGVVSETIIIESLISGSNKELLVKDVMSDAPPLISLNTGESVISSLLKFFSLVVVQDKGKLKGLITRSDFLRKIYR
jgi:predicted transcriptional regulator